MSEPIRECPYCREMVRLEAIKCPRCFTVLDRAAYLRASMGGFGGWLADRLEWSRRQPRRKFLGVCSALSRRTTVPLALFRLIFIFLTLTGNHGFLVYLLLFAVLPEAPACVVEKKGEREE